MKVKINNSPTVEGEKDPVKKVITGSISKRKKPLLMRIFGNNTKDAGTYILWDVLVPALKETIIDMVINGIELVVNGRPKTGSNLTRDRGKTIVSYSGFYNKRDSVSGRTSLKNTSRYQFDELVFETRQDAEEVLSGLVSMIEDYGAVSVSDFYSMIEYPGEFTDVKYGWDNLARAAVIRVRGGYILDLPKPLPLD